MRDVDRGGADALVQLLDFRAHFRAQQGVQVRQRFIEQEQLGLAHDGAAHGHALALAAGQGARLAVEQVVDFQDGGGGAHALFDFRLGELAQLQAKAQVVEHGLVRIQRIVLEDHGDVALARRQVVDDLPLDGDGAARDGLEPRNHAHQGGFSTTRRAHEDDEFALLDFQVDAMNDFDAVVVLLDDLFQFYT
ncbi:hypothetical protein VM94_03048 [Janthinobacterium sp. KBS0711]|nr:hypothetical protein VM94_03048 [Janthinobacterium sp. KBS0711]